jgi:hypothetical protein
LKGRNKLRVISLIIIRLFLEVQKLADYHSMSLWWRIFLKSPIQRVMLVVKFSEKEIRKAFFQMKHNKAPGPDSFPAKFYQVSWSLIKDDLMAMFREFHARNLPLFYLNFGTITLLPKEKEVKKNQQYRPICMLNVSFKIFIKVLANRLTSVACRVTKPSQSAFMPGRYIEGVVVLHETIHELKRKK